MCNGCGGGGYGRAFSPYQQQYGQSSSSSSASANVNVLNYNGGGGNRKFGPGYGYGGGHSGGGGYGNDRYGGLGDFAYYETIDMEDVEDIEDEYTFKEPEEFTEEDMQAAGVEPLSEAELVRKLDELLNQSSDADAAIFEEPIDDTEDDSFSFSNEFSADDESKREDDLDELENSDGIHEDAIDGYDNNDGNSGDDGEWSADAFFGDDGATDEFLSGR